MVVHDPIKQEQWAETRALKEEEKQQQEHRQKKGGWTVLAVQSLACALLLAFALLFRLAGGDAYDQLKTGFHSALQNNELMAVFSRLWDGDPFSDVDEVAEEDALSEDVTAAVPS